MSDTSQPLIFPVGHYVGEIHDVDGGPTFYELRGGWASLKLTEDEFKVWALAHGEPDQLRDGRRWTRDAVIEAATSLGLTNAGDILDEHLKKEILVSVAPSTNQAVEFAKQHQIAPLMIGLGNTKEEPWKYRIGINGQAFIEVTSEVLHLWTWTQVYENLWESCGRLAKIHQDLHKKEPAETPADYHTDPRVILAEFLEALHGLLVVHAAFIDIAFERRKA